MQHAGYLVRFRVREMKWRRESRGFYEGDSIYLRVRGPDGRVRDLYLGTSTRSAKPKGSKADQVAGAGDVAGDELARVGSGGRNYAERAFSVSQRRNGRRHFR